MLVQWLHLILERFLTFSQHEQERMFVTEVKLRKHYVALLAIIETVLLVFVSNLEEDLSAVVLVVHQALEVISAVHCQERKEINNHRKENTLTFKKVSFQLFLL